MQRNTAARAGTMKVVRASSRVARAGLVAMVAMVMATGGVAASHIAFNASIEVRAAGFAPASPDLAASGPNVVVAWSQPAAGSDPGSVWVRQSTSSGASFGPPVRLFKNSANAAQSLTVFSGATRHVAVWSEQVSGGGSRVFLSSAAFGGAWSAATQVSSNAGATKARNPRIVASGTILVLAYQVGSNDFGPFTGVTRVRIGSGSWVSTTLPGGSPTRVSLAVSPARVLVAWQTNAGTITVRRGAISGSGTAFAWLPGDMTLGTGAPTIVLAGTHAVLLWESNADIYRRLSADSGSSWGPQSKILDGNPTTDTDAGDPYHLYDAAMNGARVAVTAVTGDSPDLGGQGYRVTSGNFGASWTTEVSSLEAGDERQVAYTTVSGTPKLAETWLRVQGFTYPFRLRYQRQS